MFEAHRQMKGPLGRLLVVELAQGISGPFCGKLMAALGAEVIKVEPPNGDFTRRTGPFPAESGHPLHECSGAFLYLNTGKKSVKLDLRDHADRDVALNLTRHADVVVENHTPGWLEERGLGYESISVENPGLVMVSITPFGQSGPYRDFKATDMVITALSGEMLIAGERDREPLKKGGHLSEYHGALNGYLAVLSAIYLRSRTGKGQYIDVSLLEATTSILGLLVQQWSYAGIVGGRRGRNTQAWPTGYWLTRDGYVLAHPRGSTEWWSRFVRMASDQPEFADPKYSTPEGRADHVEELDAMFQSWLLERTKMEVYHLAQRQGLPFGYVADAEDLLMSPQLVSRDYFHQIDHPMADGFQYPGAPFLMDKTGFEFRRAPLLGEHQDEITSRYGS